MNNLKAHLDGELSVSENLAVTEQLKSDETVRQTIEAYSHISLVLNDGARQFEPTGQAELLQKLESSSGAREKSRPFWMKPVLYPVWGLTALVLFAVLLGPKRGHLQQEGDLAQAAGASADAAPALPSAKVAPQPKDLSNRAALSPKPSGVAMDSESSVSSSRAAAAPALPNPAAVQLIRQTSLSLESDKVQATAEKVIQTANSRGGYMESTNIQNTFAEVRVRVPAKQMDSTLNALRALGKVLSESATAEDVAKSLADNDQRLKTLRATADRYRELLKQAKNVTEMMPIQQHLDQIQSEIEAIQGQQSFTKEQVQFSSITVSISQAVKPSPVESPVKELSTTEKAFLEAKDAFKGVMGIIITMFAFAVTFSPIWIPLVLIIVWAVRYSNRKSMF